MTEQTRGYNFDDDHGLMDEPSDVQPEVAAEEEIETHQKESAVGRLKASGMLYNIMIGVVVLIALILFYNMFFASHSSKPAAAPAAANFGMQLTPNATQQTAPAMNISSNNSNMPTQTAAQNPMTGSGDYIALQKQDLQTMVSGFTQIANKDNSVISGEVGKLQASLNSELEGQAISNQQAQALQAQVQQLNAKIDTINQSLGDIAKDLDATQSQLQLILAQTAQQATQLSLRAVVPGRAWLVDSKGNTTTVTVGDVLPYYGKVTNIDADAGKVYMSSGYIFQ